MGFHLVEYLPRTSFFIEAYIEMGILIPGTVLCSSICFLFLS